MAAIYSIVFYQSIIICKYYYLISCKSVFIYKFDQIKLLKQFCNTYDCVGTELFEDLWSDKNYHCSLVSHLPKASFNIIK